MGAGVNLRLDIASAGDGCGLGSISRKNGHVRYGRSRYASLAFDTDYEKRAARVELATSGLESLHSTIELRPQLRGILVGTSEPNKGESMRAAITQAIGEER